MVVWFALNTLIMLKVGNPMLVSKLVLTIFSLYIIPNPLNHWNLSSNSFSISGMVSESLHFWECLPVLLKDKLLFKTILAHNCPPSRPWGVIWHLTVAEEMSANNPKFCSLINFYWIVERFFFSPLIRLSPFWKCMK
jgi:hypothetical protein